VRIIPNSYGSEEARLREFNPNHEPAGTSKGGQFARKTGGTPAGWKVEQNEGGRWEVTNPSGWKAVYDSEEEARARVSNSLSRRRFAKVMQRKYDAEQLANAEDQPLPYEPPLGGKPVKVEDPLAADEEVRKILGEGEITDEEDLGGGINGSYKVTLEDGTEAVWKPESGEAWTTGDAKRNQGDDDGGGSNFSVDTDAVDEAVSEAVGQAHTAAEQAYVKEARKQWVNEFEPIYHAVLEEYSRAGKLTINPGSDMGASFHKKAFLDALMPPDDPDGGMFTEEGLLGESAESMLRQHLDDIIKQGVRAMPQELDTPNADFFGERSKYFNPNDGLDNWRETPEAQEVERKAYDDAVEQQRYDWEEQREEADEEYIRGSITNRDFSQAQRDAAAYELDRIVGLGTTPVTVTREHNGERGSIQLWASHQRARVAGDSEDQQVRAAMLDYLIGNTDRHGGNFIRDRGGLHTIDNGLTFPKSDSELRSMIVRSVIGSQSPTTPETRARAIAGLRSRDWNTWATEKGMDTEEREMFLDRVNTLLGGLEDGDDFWEIARRRTGDWF